MDVVIYSLVSVLLLQSLTDAKDPDLYCAACHMLVDEIHWEINQTDPKKTIQVGSFRIMPDGTQRLNEIPYKQSSVQLTELLETVCSQPTDYYQTVNKVTNTKIYRRQNRRDGQPSSLTDLTFNKESSKMLKFACEGIAEDFEEEILETFKDKEDDNYLRSVCVTRTELCKEDQLYDVNPDIAPLPDKGEGGTTEESPEDNGDNHTDADDEVDKSKTEL